MKIRARVYAMFAYDVGWSIDLVKVAELLGVDPSAEDHRIRPDRPIQFQVKEGASDVDVTLYEFGGVSIRFCNCFEGEIEELVGYSASIDSEKQLKRRAQTVLQQALEQISEAVEEPDLFPECEDYWSFQISSGESSSDESESILSLLSTHGDTLAQVASGSSRPLSKARVIELIHSCLQCYADDAVVVGWHGAILLSNTDALSGSFSGRAVAILEEINASLLQLRRVELLLKRELQKIDSRGEKKRLAGDRVRLEGLALEIAELVTEIGVGLEEFEAEDAALLYRVASDRFEVPRRLEVVKSLNDRLGDLIQRENDHLKHLASFRVEVAVMVLVLIEVVRGFWH